MKRILAFVLAVFCCAALTACAESDKPTQPTQSAQLAQSAQPGVTQNANVQNDTAAEPGDATEATEPEDEFVPTPTEDLLPVEFHHPDGSEEIIYVDMNLGSKYWGQTKRSIRTLPDGTVEDSSFYPGTEITKLQITTRTDGSIQELHFIPGKTQANGKKGNDIIIYVRLCYPSGRESEEFCDENGNPVRSVVKEADGSVETTTYDGEGGYCTIGTYPDGSSMEQRGKLSGQRISYAWQNADGSGGETHYDDSGREIYQCQRNADGSETGMNFDENGRMIRQYVRNPDGTYQEGILENGEWVWTEGTVEETQEDE